MARTALIAIGGNSLIRSGERGTIAEQRANAQRTAYRIAELVARGWKVLITHGNGPQVGAALLRSERAANEVYTHPLDVCVATTQTEIGYLLELGLSEALRPQGLETHVVTILTRVRVDENDPAFQNPMKPIGPFYSEREAARKKRELGWVMVEDAMRGYRRVVPSPEPLEVLESSIISGVMQLGMIVIALGGGGVPVARRPDGNLVGVEAVIDKDRASALLASSLGVESLIITTDVDCVYLEYKKPGQQALNRTTIAEMERYLKQGHFAPGSMGPKIESALRFLRNGGREAIITCYEHLLDAVEGKAGTHIVAG